MKPGTLALIVLVCLGGIVLVLFGFFRDKDQDNEATGEDQGTGGAPDAFNNPARKSFTKRNTNI